MSFTEHLAKFVTNKESNITNCGLLGQFKDITLHPDGNAVLCDELWIPIAKKYRGQEATRAWQVIQTLNTEGKIRIVTMPKHESSWKSI
jgi:hypothetical protein